MAIGEVTIRVVLENAKAVRALAFVCRTLGDLLEDFGYREDVKKAAKAAAYAVRHLATEVKSGRKHWHGK